MNWRIILFGCPCNKVEVTIDLLKPEQGNTAESTQSAASGWMYMRMDVYLLPRRVQTNGAVVCVDAHTQVGDIFGGGLCTWPLVHSETESAELVVYEAQWSVCDGAALSSHSSTVPNGTARYETVQAASFAHVLSPRPCLPKDIFCKLRDRFMVNGDTIAVV